MRTVDERVLAQELDIRAQLKAIYPQATFSIAGLRLRNDNARALLGPTYDTPDFDGVFCDGFYQLEDAPAGSAACAFEKFRARLWMLSTIRAHFAGHDNLYFITLADLRHRCDGGGLLAHTAARTFYQLTQSCAQLALLAPGYKMVAVAEISATRVDGVMKFEPHVHVVTAGLTKPQLVSVLPRSIRPHSRRISSIDDIEVCGLYISKFSGETYSRYWKKGDSRPSRRRNKMGPDELADWLDWHARLQVPDLVMTRGIPNDLRRVSLSKLLDELVGPYRRPPQPRLGERYRRPSGARSAGYR